jgi:hypothetical protein
MSQRKTAVQLLSIVACFLLIAALDLRAQEPVTPIHAPSTPLPAEQGSRGVTRFSFVVYGDTRGHFDDTAIQYDHSLVVQSMLRKIKELAGTEYPVRFVLSSGDAVSDGRKAGQWNTSYTPLIDRLEQEGGVTFFPSPGNHEHTDTAEGMKNYLDAVRNLIPSDGSPHRLAGTATYAFGYGNSFFVALDANIASDQKQFDWVKSQFEGLDRNRYPNVFVFCHQAPFSSGPHGGSHVEEQTIALRTLYMPLFHTHHVRAVFSGHEHLFDHWVEHYTDSSGTHRMDLVVSGGGGAPNYEYNGEPDLHDYLEANKASKISFDHLAKPGMEPGENPHHYVVVHLDGDKLSLEVIGVDWGVGFAPYRSNKVELTDK